MQLNVNPQEGAGIVPQFSIKKNNGTLSNFGTSIMILVLATTILGWINFFIGIKNMLVQLRMNLGSIFDRLHNALSKDPDNLYENESQGVDSHKVNLYNCEEQCPICLSDIKYKVSILCNHSFCTECILDYWDKKDKRQISCPICRSQITMLFRQYDNDVLNQEQQPQQLTKKMKTKLALWENKICHYNFLFASKKRSLKQMWKDIPFLLKQTARLMSTTSGIMYMISTACSSHYFVLLSIYVISPIDLIPECIFGLLGIIDDLFVVAAIIVIISNIYYNFIYHRDYQQHQSNQQQIQQQQESGEDEEEEDGENEQN